MLLQMPAKNKIGIIVLAVAAVLFATVIGYRQYAARHLTRVSIEHEASSEQHAQSIKVPALDSRVFADLINSMRAKRQLPPLSLSADLSAAALAHARDITRHPEMDHIGSDSLSPWDRVSNSGYRPALVGETVSLGTKLITSESLVTLLAAKHPDLLFSKEIRDFGVAKVLEPNSIYKIYWVVEFAAPTK
jgi:uncharacterized protein YkwD